MVHSINANQARYWRKLYQQRLLRDGTDEAALLPVGVSGGLPKLGSRRMAALRKLSAGGAGDGAGIHGEQRSLGWNLLVTAVEDTDDCVAIEVEGAHHIEVSFLPEFAAGVAP